MRKYVGLFAVLMLTSVVLSAFPVHAGIPYCWFNKWIREPDGCWLVQYTAAYPRVVVDATVGEDVHWEMMITVTPDRDIFGAVVTDRFGAEIEIDTPNPLDPSQGTAWWDHGPGRGRKKSGKVFLTWIIGDLLEGETACLYFEISTGLNGAGKQCYTSCGCYELNSGAVLKFFDRNGKQVSVYTLPIYVQVSA